MTLSDAEPNREASPPPAIQPASDRSRLSSSSSGSQDDPGGEKPSLALPLRRQELERRLQSSPSDLSASVELAGIYRREDRPADAVRILRKASEFHSDDPEFLWAYEEALLSHSLQQLREVTALAARLKTVEVDEEKERCEANWAFCRIEVCRARLQRDPSNQHLRLTMAQALKEVEQFDEAIQEAEIAAKDRRFAPTAHLIRAQCLEAMGKHVAALPAYRAAAMRRSDPAPPRVRLVAMRDAAEIADALGLDVSAQRYRRFLQRAEAELNSSDENHPSEAPSSHRLDRLKWDAAEEKLFADYESTTLKTREELNRLVASFRHARRQDRNAVVRKANARCQSAQNEYNRRKSQSLKQQRKVHARLDRAIDELDGAIDGVRTIVAEHLDYLPEVLPRPKADQPVRPSSVPEAEEAIRRAIRQIGEIGMGLRVRTPRKLADVFWVLPAMGGLFILLWAALAFLIGGPQPWSAIAVGILAACCMFLTVLAILQVPLRRQAREAYPRAEHLYADAHQAHEAGKSIAAATAAEKETEITKQRDVELRAVERWEQARFQAIDQANHEKAAAERKRLEQELKTIRQQFEADLQNLDRQSRATSADARLND